jgi:hemerythrin-like metal-binding protein
VLLTWKEQYALGIPSVDAEHREMIEMINALHETLLRPGQKDSVLAFLGEIYARISAHFALEEKMMRERRYDQFEDHKADHERLLDEIRDIMDRYEDDERYDEPQLARQLDDWFAVHFRTRDARLHKFLS